MRIFLFGGPMHGVTRYTDSMDPILVPVGDSDEELDQLWEDLKDGHMPPPEKNGMYVPWMSWRAGTFYQWAGTEAAHNEHGDRWAFMWPRLCEKHHVGPHLQRLLLIDALRHRVVWVRKPTVP